VWTFWTPTSDEYLVGAVIEAASTELLIIPLLSDTTWATDDDVVLSADVLGYPTLAPIWGADHVLIEQAAEPVDALSEENLALLYAAYDAFFSGEDLPYPGGSPVIGERDPRIAAHAALAEGLRPVFAPWVELQVAEELGPVVAQKRSDRDLDLEELEIEDAGIETSTWMAFEAGEIDPYVAIPANGMVRALGKLGVLASRRVLDLARASVRANYRGDDITAAPAMARRRHGVAPTARPDPEAAAKAAEKYADALAKEMGL